MTRRVLLLAACAVPLRADAADQAWELIGAAARALTEATSLPPPNRGTAVPFLSFFDRKMTGYETLRNYAIALVSQADVQSTLDLVSNEGDDQVRQLEVDWTLRVTDSATSITSSQRRERVRARIEKQGRRWKIVAFEPLGLFAPPRQ